MSEQNVPEMATAEKPSEGEISRDDEINSSTFTEVQGESSVEDAEAIPRDDGGLNETRDRKSDLILASADYDERLRDLFDQHGEMIGELFVNARDEMRAVNPELKGDELIDAVLDRISLDLESKNPELVSVWASIGAILKEARDEFFPDAFENSSMKDFLDALFQSTFRHVGGEKRVSSESQVIGMDEIERHWEKKDNFVNFLKLVYSENKLVNLDGYPASLRNKDATQDVGVDDMNSAIKMIVTLLKTDESNNSSSLIALAIAKSMGKNLGKHHQIDNNELTRKLEELMSKLNSSADAFSG